MFAVGLANLGLLAGAAGVSAVAAGSLLGLRRLRAKNNGQ